MDVLWYSINLYFLVVELLEINLRDKSTGKVIRGDSI
jgi:hypothetical protein